MNDGRDSSSDLLARARRAWSPRATDTERVRHSIAAALAGTAGAGRPTAGARAPAPTPTWVSRFLVAGTIAAASGGLGYWAGHRAGLRDAPPPMPAISYPHPEPAAATEMKPPIAPRTAPETQPLVTPSLVPPLRHDGHSPRRGSEIQTVSPTGSLDLEVRALRNAERALRDGTPGLALAFLQELDRQVPNGQLAEERDAAATLARCARGDHPFGVNLGEEFAEHHPGSVYRARVDQACAQTDSPTTGDSPPRRSGP
jgi:hypothetical protein